MEDGEEKIREEKQDSTPKKLTIEEILIDLDRRVVAIEAALFRLKNI